MTWEQQRVLWACYHTWATSLVPPEQRWVVYSYVSFCYQQRFGTDFSPWRMRELADLGYLQRGGTTRAGKRQNYSLVNPAEVERLLWQWGLLEVSTTGS
jgi:hypothetical protein